MAKLPSFQFYPGDWIKDPGLRRCSHAAKGVWIDMLCLMFECEERGVLMTNGRAWSKDEIARAVGGDQGVTLACIQELLDSRVARIRSNSAVYSHRMVLDEQIRSARAAAGYVGGKQKASKRLAKRLAKRGSSSSSSSSDNPCKPPKRSASKIEAIYDAYPRKEARRVALAEISRALDRICGKPEPPEDPEAWLLAKVQAYAADVAKWPKEDRQFVPHPRTWFHQDRFDDDPHGWKGAAKETEQKAWTPE